MVVYILEQLQTVGIMAIDISAIALVLSVIAMLAEQIWAKRSAPSQADFARIHDENIALKSKQAHLEAEIHKFSYFAEKLRDTQEELSEVKGELTKFSYYIEKINDIEGLLKQPPPSGT